MIRDVIDRWSRQTANIHFLQIGSCDGVTDDPLHEFIVRDRWSGILVEPLPHLFDRLVANYNGCQDLAFENVAISDAAGAREFWYVQSDPRLPAWCEELGSFSREIVLSHQSEVFELAAHVVQCTVECMRLQVLLRKHPLPWIDILHVDAEGYDFEAIKQIDFTSTKPSLLLYEHKHLGAQDRAICRDYLQRLGYDVLEDGPDSLAIGPFSRRPCATLCDAVRTERGARCAI